jgi:hypothetical protein
LTGVFCTVGGTLVIFEIERSKVSNQTGYGNIQTSQYLENLSLTDIKLDSLVHTKELMMPFEYEVKGQGSNWTYMQEYIFNIYSIY